MTAKRFDQLWICRKCICVSLYLFREQYDYFMVLTGQAKHRQDSALETTGIPRLPEQNP
jgi:hypothetical protein